MKGSKLLLLRPRMLQRMQIFHVYSLAAEPHIPPTHKHFLTVILLKILFKFYIIFSPTSLLCSLFFSFLRDLHRRVLFTHCSWFCIRFCTCTLTHMSWRLRSQLFWGCTVSLCRYSLSCSKVKFLSVRVTSCLGEEQRQPEFGTTCSCWVMCSCAATLMWPDLVQISSRRLKANKKT